MKIAPAKIAPRTPSDVIRGLVVLKDTVNMVAYAAYVIHFKRHRGHFMSLTPR